MPHQLIYRSVHVGGVGVGFIFGVFGGVGGVGVGGGSGAGTMRNVRRKCGTGNILCFCLCFCVLIVSCTYC